MNGLNRLTLTVVFALTLVGSAAVALRSIAAPAAANEKPLAKFEVYQDRGGEFRWRLRATNTQILATSGDGYKAKRDCLHAIESVKRDVANAPVEDTTEGKAAGSGHAEDGHKEGQGEPPAAAKRPAK